jgi:putative peptidoglycan lipid II flippase
MKITPETVKEALLKSSLINIFARGFGYLQTWVIAVLLGFSYKTDAFFMALGLMGIFMTFINIFDSIGVPTLVRARKDKKEFHRSSEILLSFTLLLSCVILILAIVLYPLLSKIPVGFKEDTRYLLKLSYFILLPWMFFSFFFHHAGAILRSLKSFTPFFIADFLNVFLGFILITIGLLTFKNVLVLPIAFSLSQIVSTLYLVVISKEYFHFKIFLNKEMKDILKHFFYLAILFSLFHLLVLTDRAFASLLPSKSVTALYYGWLVSTVPLRIVKTENILITPLSEVEGRLDRLNFYIKRILLFNIPLAGAIFLFSPFIIKTLFNYGAFSFVDLQLTTEATKFYSLSLPLMALWPIFFRTYQIKKIFKPVAIIAFFTIILNFILDYYFLVVLKIGLKGIPLATFFALLLLCMLSYLKLTKYDKDK